MPTFLERYRDGDCVAVWTILVALGEGVRHELYYADAVAVAAETMYRARHNVELLMYNVWRGWDTVSSAIPKISSGCGPEHFNRWWRWASSAAKARRSEVPPAKRRYAARTGRPGKPKIAASLKKPPLKNPDVFDPPGKKTVSQPQETGKSGRRTAAHLLAGLVRTGGRRFAAWGRMMSQSQGQ